MMPLPHDTDGDGHFESRTSVLHDGIKPAAHTVDIERIERAVREILIAIGEDPERDGLQKTPHRVAKMYEEIFSGLGEDPGRSPFGAVRG